MKISIVIDNYNYPQYLTKAIDSALGQTYKDVEVIVVDDGSTDGLCLPLLRQYESRVRLILKSNGGQASAFNAGFAASTGDVVMLLDADDMLRPDAAACVAAAWRPGLSKIHYPLSLIDEAGRSLNAVIPNAPLPEGDLSAAVLNRGFYVSSPTSGNAFSRDYLKRVMPMPEKDWRMGAEGYLVFLAPFFGEIGVVRERITYYRIHGASVTAMNGSGSIDPARMMKLLDSDIRLRRTLETFARNRHLPLSDQAVYSHWLHRKLRLACFKLSRDLHPFAGDSSARLALSLLRSVWSAKELGLRSRVLFSGWGCLTALAPSRLAGPLIRIAFSPAARPAVLKGIVS